MCVVEASALAPRACPGRTECGRGGGAAVFGREEAQAGAMQVPGSEVVLPTRSRGLGLQNNFTKWG